MTAQAFERLLGRLGGDAEAGGREYDALRRKLILFFAVRGAAAAEDLADETIDRVARRLDEGEAVEEIRAYFFGVARRVLMEEGKRRGRERAFIDGLGTPPPRPHDDIALLEARARCLQRCLAALPDAHRRLIVGYYEGEGATYLKERKVLAERLGISYTALKTQAHRVRNHLERCLRECLETPSEVTDRPERPR